MANRKLALEIQQILEVPLHKRSYPNYGTKILKAIVQTIVEALRRGETVHVRGFGTFKVVTRRNRPSYGPYITATDRAPILQHYQPRKIVIFKPAKPLLAMLNLPSDGYEPNYAERHTQSRWLLPSPEEVEHED